MKLRMLNGSHSTMAYLGYLGGYQYVNEAIADAGIRTLIHGLMTEEVMPTLPMDQAPARHLSRRAARPLPNPALKHRTWQIAMDGCQKLPQRLLGTIRDRARPRVSRSRGSPWASPRGCATSPASTSRAAPSM